MRFRDAFVQSGNVPTVNLQMQAWPGSDAGPRPFAAPAPLPLNLPGMRAPIAVLTWLAMCGAATAFGAPPAGLDARLDRLVAAYPDFLRGHDGNWLVLKDGRRFAISDGRTDKPFDDMIEHPDIDDMFFADYPAGAEARRTAGELRSRPGALRAAVRCDIRRLPARRRGRRSCAASPGYPGIMAGMSRSRPSMAWTGNWKRSSPSSTRCRRATCRISSTVRAPIIAAAWRDRPRPRPMAGGIAIDIDSAGVRLLALVGQGLAQPGSGGDRAHFRAPWLHLGRTLVSLRHHAFRIPAGADRATLTWIMESPAVSRFILHV